MIKHVGEQHELAARAAQLGHVHVDVDGCKRAGLELVDVLGLDLVAHGRLQLRGAAGALMSMLETVHVWLG